MIPSVPPRGLVEKPDGGFPKQEQEPASDEVVEVAPGVVRMQLPISMPGLGHVNTYAMVGRRGLVVVDPGLPTEESYTALKKRLSAAGMSASQVAAAVVTHSHPDHYGGVRRLMDESSAVLLADADFGHLVMAPGVDGCSSEVHLTHTGGHKWMLPRPWNGQPLPPPVPARRLLALRFAGRKAATSFLPPPPKRRLSDGDKVEMGGRMWVTVRTPGHTLDHLCFYDPTTGVLISGDHVLPTITPHVPGVGGGPDPLSGFLSSLDKVASVGDITRVLPAHGHPFDNFAERVEEIKYHHAARLQRIHEALAKEGAMTVEATSHHLFREARWGPMAESEAFAHLEHMRLKGEVSHRVVKGEFVYELV